MPRGGGGSKDYEVVIPIRTRDDTSAGNRKVKSSVHSMLQEIAADVEKSTRYTGSGNQQQAAVDKMLRSKLDAIERTNLAQVKSERAAAAESAKILKQKEAEIQRGIRAEESAHSKMLKDRLRAIEQANLAEARLESSASAKRIAARQEVANKIKKVQAESGNTSIYGGPLASDITIAKATESAAVSATAAVEKQTVATVGLTAASLPLVAAAKSEVSATKAQTTTLTAQISRLKEATLIEKIKADTTRQGIKTSALLAESQKVIQKSLQVSARAEVDATKAALAMAEGNSTSSKSAVRAAVAFFGMGQGSDKAATSILGMSGATLALAAAAAVVVVAIVAALAVVGIIAKLALTGAANFAAWGDEIYKLRAKTKISTDTLSGLLLVSRETGVEAKQLGVAFTRLQVNIEKGVTEPGSNAGRAIRTLGINLNDLKNMTPTEQVGAVTKALNDLGNQNVKAYVSSALLGRGFQQLAPALQALGGNLDDASKRAEKFGLNFTDAQVEAAHRYTVAQKDLGLAWEGFTIAIGERAVPALEHAFERLSEILSDSRGNWSKLGDIVEHVIDDLRIAAAIFAHPDTDIFKAMADERSLIAKEHADDESAAARRALDRKKRPAELKAELDSLTKIHQEYEAQNKSSSPTGMEPRRYPAAMGLTPLSAMAALEKRQREIKSVLSGEGTGSEELVSKTNKSRSAIDSLTKQVGKAQLAVDSLYASSGRAFELKFKLEDLQQTQHDLEGILKLEHSLGLALSVPPRGGGLAAIRDRTHYLEQQKQVVDGVTSATYAQNDAEFKLAQLVLTQSIPLVDKETRSQTKYLSALADRRDAELELTSDLQSAVLLRTRALTEEQRVMKDTYTQYVNLQLDAVKSSEEARLANIKAELQLKIDTGAEPAIQHELEIQLKTQADQLKPPLVQVSEGVDTIVGQLKDILGALSGRSGGTTQVGAQSYSLIGGSLGGRQQADLTRSLSRVVSSPAIQRAVMAAAAATGLPPELINSVIATESGGNTRALSPKGATGLMQIMPSHGLGNAAFNPQTNVMAGAKYLASLLQRYNGDVGLALAAYNAGPGRVSTSIPRFTETQNYVRKNEFLLNAQTQQDQAHAKARPKPFVGVPFLDQLFHRGRMPGDEKLPGDDIDVEKSTTHQPSVSVAVEQAAKRVTVANTAAITAVDDLTTAQQRLNSAQQEDADARKIVAELAKKGLTDGAKTLEQLGVQAALKDREAVRVRDDVQAAIQAGVVDHDISEGRARDVKYVQRVVQDADRSRAASAKNTVDQIIADENLLFQIEQGNEEALKQLRENSQASRVRGHLGLKQEISDLEDQIAHAGEDSADRERAAWLRAQRDIIEGDQRARESQIESQVKIADQAVYHVERVRAAILDHMASRPGVSEIFSQGVIDTIDATGDAISKVIGKITDKMGAFGKIIQNVLSDLARLALDRVFRTLLSTILGPGPGGGGGGSGGIFGSSGGGGGGTNPLAMITKMITGGAEGKAGGGISVPASASGGGATWANFKLGSPGDFIGLLKGGGAGPLGKLGAGVGQMLPLLGLGLGAQAGGQSRFGSILGGAGGLIAGGIGAALLAPGMFAATGIFGSMGPMIAGLLTNPITAVAAVALIAGAIILGKNAQRRKDEKTRNAISNDTGTAIWALIDQARLGDMTMADANAQWNEIDKSYHEKIAQIKDGKTRRNAELQWTNDFMPLKKILDAAVAGSVERANARARMSPVFSSGGYSHLDQLIRVRPGEGIRYPGSDVLSTIPGRDLGYDSQHMYAPKGTQIVSKSEMRNARGYNSGGTVGADGMPTSRSLRIDSIELNIDKDGIATAVIKSPDFDDAVVKSVRVGKAKKRL